MSDVEAWAGIECTVNRVGDRYFDQVMRNGHHQRGGDLLHFASLGIRAMRYPVLWERVHEYGWAWSDERLNVLRSLRVRPIVGLIHHGSGPRETSLVDPGFPDLFADYAYQCAVRYPWVDEWTPVNEPLTTARFCGLYGFWYPHAKDDHSFLTALINQCKATVLAMRAIRAVNPQALLVQTEDLGQTQATAPLAYQAEFDNHRRWLSLDLLTGRVGPTHPLWGYCLHAGIEPDALSWFIDNPCPPDVVGINHYLTSERWLDHRLDRYPPATHGGNGRDRYADVEAVRTGDLVGPQELLRQVWKRYHLPIAVTEVHLHCTREEQVRWLHEVWTAARTLKRQGVDIRAVTAWAGLGSYDWDSLLTQDRGSYEPGLFDLRGPKPRPTAAARFVTAMAHGEPWSHPLLSVPGWWRRESRVLYPARPAHHAPIPDDVPPLLITGGTGTLGRAFARCCQRRGIPYRLTTRADLDIAEPASVQAAMHRHNPWAVVNTAGFVRVADAEQDAERCWRENVTGPTVLAAGCRAAGIPVVTFSSDLVFAGERSTPYRESDRPGPLSVYGLSKAVAESQVLAANPTALVVRSAAFFSPWDRHNFVTVALRALADGQRFAASGEVTVSPTYVPDLVDAVLDLLIDREAGIWHVVNDGLTTWMDLARSAARLAGLDENAVEPTVLPGFMPRYSAMTSERGALLRPWDAALAHYWQEVERGVDGDAEHCPQPATR